MSDESVEKVNQYEGIRGFIRIFAEVIAWGYQHEKERARTFWSVIRGRIDLLDDTCQMKGFDDTSVGHYPHPDDYRDDLTVCRRHWLSLRVVVVLAKALVYGIFAAAIAAYAYLVVMML